MLQTKKKKELHVEKRGAKPVVISRQSPNGNSSQFKPGRIFLVGAVVGEQSTGKSYQLDKEILQYTQGYSGSQKGRKVLILDTHGEYTRYPEISYSHVVEKLRKNEFTNNVAYRLNLRGRDIEDKKRIAQTMVGMFNNGMLVLDDIDGYDPHSRNSPLISSMIGNRHANLDMLLIHQSLDMVTKNFYRFGTSIRLHKQFSNDDLIKEKTTECFPILRIAQNIVLSQYNSGNEKYFVIINLRKKKIYGCGDEKIFRHAILEFINANKKEVTRKINSIITINPNLYDRRKSKGMHFLAMNELLKEYFAYKG